MVVTIRRLEGVTVGGVGVGGLCGIHASLSCKVIIVAYLKDDEAPHKL